MPILKSSSIRGIFPLSSTRHHCLHITITSSTPTSPTIPDFDLASSPIQLTLDKATSPTTPDINKATSPAMPVSAKRSVHFSSSVPCAGSHCPNASRRRCKSLKCDSELRNKIDRRKDRRAKLQSDSSAYFSMIKERTRSIKLYCDLEKWESYAMQKKRDLYESVKREKIDGIDCYCVECKVEFLTRYNALVNMKLDVAKAHLETLGQYQDRYSLI